MSAELLERFWHNLPRRYDGAVCAAKIKTSPDAFVVKEHLGFEHSGEGEHRWFYIEKRGSNTQWVAKQLAAALDVAERDVGYSGMKDRHAVTRQWFSAPSSQVLDIDNDDWRVLTQVQHRKKCRRGVHKENSFQIQLELSGDVDAPAVSKSAIEDRWDTITSDGVPNYFGEQRFGRDGANLAKLPDFLAGKKRNRDPQKRAMLYSAARAALFNQLLGYYLASDEEPPKYCMLPGRLDEPDESQRRELEKLEEWQRWIKGLRKAKVDASRRPAWLSVSEPSLEWLAGDSLQLSFTLPRGSFATAVLRELVIW